MDISKIAAKDMTVIDQWLDIYEKVNQKIPDLIKDCKKIDQQFMGLTLLKQQIEQHTNKSVNPKDMENIADFYLFFFALACLPKKSYSINACLYCFSASLHSINPFRLQTLTKEIVILSKYK